jgi:hypothetical protein
MDCSPLYIFDITTSAWALRLGRFHVRVIFMKRAYVQVGGEVFINLEEAVSIIAKMKDASTPGTFVHASISEVETMFRNLLKEANDKPHS